MAGRAVGGDEAHLGGASRRHISDRSRLQQLEQLEADEAGDHRRGGGDRRDDLAGDLLRAVAVGLLDRVVARAEVRRGGDEVDVEVRVVILFKVDRVHTVPSEARRLRQLRDDRRAERVVVLARRRLARVGAVGLFLRVRLDLDARLRRKLGHLRCGGGVGGDRTAGVCLQLLSLLSLCAP